MSDGFYVHTDWEVKDKRHKIDPCYGLEKRIITDEDIEALKKGKILWTGINADEYAMILVYEDFKNEPIKYRDE